MLAYGKNMPACLKMPVHILAYAEWHLEYAARICGPGKVFTLIFKTEVFTGFQVSMKNLVRNRDFRGEFVNR